MENNSLTHYGIRGMKWGVRRYQNKDGSLTVAGQKRYDRDIQDNNSKKKDNRIVIDGPNARRWVKEDVDRTKKVVDSTSNLVKDLEKLDDTSRALRTKKTVDLSEMSDQELRDRINRANLERQYLSSLEPEVSKGRDYARAVLDTAGSVLALGSSALAIALAIKELRG